MYSSCLLYKVILHYKCLNKIFFKQRIFSYLYFRTIKVFLILDKHICLQCGRKYKTKSGLNLHIHVECGKPPEFCCYICKKEFKQKGNYQRRLIIVHPIIVKL